MAGPDGSYGTETPQAPSWRLRHWGCCCGPGAVISVADRAGRGLHGPAFVSVVMSVGLFFALHLDEVVAAGNLASEGEHAVAWEDGNTSNLERIGVHVDIA